jgi:hypothetical protein
MRRRRRLRFDTGLAHVAAVVEPLLYDRGPDYRPRDNGGCCCNRPWMNVRISARVIAITTTRR